MFLFAADSALLPYPAQFWPLLSRAAKERASERTAERISISAPAGADGGWPIFAVSQSVSRPSVRPSVRPYAVRPPPFSFTHFRPAARGGGGAIEAVRK